MSTLAVADPTAAMCAFLSAQIGGMLGKNSSGDPAVYRPEVPKTDMALMPQRAVAVRYAGGTNRFAGSFIQASTPRLDVSCYGSTRQDTDEVARAVFLAMKGLSMVSWENTMLYSATALHPIPLPDQQTLWPTSVVQATVMHADYASA